MCLEEGLEEWPPAASPPRIGGWKGKMGYQKLTFQGHLPSLALISDRSDLKEGLWEGDASPAPAGQSSLHPFPSSRRRGPPSPA